VELKGAQREFNVRYYRWALQDWRREIEQGFPLLKTFKGGPAWYALDMMSRMAIDQQHLFGRALAKRFHRHAVQVTQETVTLNEEEMCRQYCQRVDLSPSELSLHQRELAGERNVYANVQLLRKLIKAEMQALRLERAEMAATLWRYTTRINEWSVVTEIQTSGASAEVTYSHEIVLADERQSTVLDGGQVVTQFIPLARFVSFNSWLGISSGTKWSGLVDSDLPQTANALSRMCAYFLEAVPKLVSGLTI